MENEPHGLTPLLSRHTVSSDRTPRPTESGAGSGPLGSVICDGEERVVAYRVCLVDLCGGDPTSAIFLQQCIYWTGRTKDPNGWFFKSHGDWWIEVRLTRSQIDRIRRLLKAKDILEEKHRGALNGVISYRLNLSVLHNALRPFVEKLQTIQTVRRNPTNRFTENQRTNQSKSDQPNKEAESTTEITTKSSVYRAKTKTASVRVPTEIDMGGKPSDPKKAWGTAKGELLLKLGQQRFDTWIAPAHLLAAEAERLVIRVPNSDFLWIAEKFEAEIAHAIAGVGYGEALLVEDAEGAHFGSDRRSASK